MPYSFPDSWKQTKGNLKTATLSASPIWIAVSLIIGFALHQPGYAWLIFLASIRLEKTYYGD